MDPTVVQVCADRLRGNGAWQGNGLLAFLALTSLKDPLRPQLRAEQEACEKIVLAADADTEPDLTEHEQQAIWDLTEYAQVFQGNLGTDRTDQGQPGSPLGE